MGNRLTDGQVQQFDRDGYVGPFTLCSPEEMHGLWRRIKPKLYDISTAPYPGSTMNYDRHLDVEVLSRLVSRSEIVEKMQSLLGETVFCWRTEWFPKNPGDEGTEWHQVESFVEFEGGAKLVPQEEHYRPWEMSAWVAMTDATKDNGCMRIIPRTHRTWFYDEKKNIPFQPQLINQKLVAGQKRGFYGYDYESLKLDPDWTPDETQAIDFEMKAGQFLIFTSRVLHGSFGNRTEQKRMGWAIRYVAGDVHVYPGMRSFSHFGETFPLDRHSCVLVAGTDRYGLNKVTAPLALA
jgi:chlorinating enzyme